MDNIKKKKDLKMKIVKKREIKTETKSKEGRKRDKNNEGKNQADFVGISFHRIKAIHSHYFE